MPRHTASVPQVLREGGLYTDLDRLHDVNLDVDVLERNATRMLLPLSDRGENGIGDIAQARRPP